MLEDSANLARRGEAITDHVIADQLKARADGYERRAHRATSETMHEGAEHGSRVFPLLQ